MIKGPCWLPTQGWESVLLVSWVVSVNMSRSLPKSRIISSGMLYPSFFWYLRCQYESVLLLTSLKIYNTAFEKWFQQPNFLSMERLVSVMWNTDHQVWNITVYFCPINLQWFFIQKHLNHFGVVVIFPLWKALPWIKNLFVHFSHLKTRNFDLHNLFGV